MRSLVDVNALHPLIHGYHENPFEVLGPHEIEDNGRRALAVRAYLPKSQQEGYAKAHPRAVIVPPVFIGENCRLEDSVVGPNAVLDCSRPSVRRTFTTWPPVAPTSSVRSTPPVSK
ncbi:MAG TPA: hypothetical protein PKC18_07550 [Lacipirellulaceae bacterium]|nr:hypothetical protein [Lacipirellulaceae bacterium]